MSGNGKLTRTPTTLAIARLDEVRPNGYASAASRYDSINSVPLILMRGGIKGTVPRTPRSTGSRPWFARAAVAYAFTAIMLGTTLPTPLYNIYQLEFGFSQLMVTIIFAIYAMGVVFALLVFGRMSDQVGRRVVLLLALGLSALSGVVFLLANDTNLLLVGRVLSGLSAGVCTGTATAALVDLFPADDRGKATLVATIVNMGGLGLGSMLSGVLASWSGSPLHTSFCVYLVLLLPASIGIWLIAEPAVARRQWHVTVQRLRIPADIGPTFVRSALVVFPGFAVLGLFSAVAPAFLSQIHGVTDPAIIGSIVCLVFLASAVGQISLGRMNKARALAIGCIGLVIGMVLVGISLVDSFTTLLLLGGVVAGFGQGLSFRAGLDSLNDNAPITQRAEVISAFFIVAYAGITIPVVGVGVLEELAGLRTAGLVFSAGAVTIALTAIALLRYDHA